MTARPISVPDMPRTYLPTYLGIKLPEILLLLGSLGVDRLPRRILPQRICRYASARRLLSDRARLRHPGRHHGHDAAGDV